MKKGQKFTEYTKSRFEKLLESYPELVKVVDEEYPDEISYQLKEARDLGYFNDIILMMESFGTEHEYDSNYDRPGICDYWHIYTDDYKDGTSCTAIETGSHGGVQYDGGYIRRTNMESIKKHLDISLYNYKKELNKLKAMKDGTK